MFLYSLQGKLGRFEDYMLKLVQCYLTIFVNIGLVKYFVNEPFHVLFFNFILVFASNQSHN